MISPIGNDPSIKRSVAGFTLLELMAVIVIMAVMVGFSVPRFRRTFNHLQLQVFANNVARLLAYANQRAVTRGEVLRVHFDVEGRRYWLASVNEAGESTRIASKLNRVSSIPLTILLDPSGREVNFYPDGGADRFEMAILNDQQDGYRLVTNVWTGRAKLMDVNGR
ncbi:MAG: Tfp pilus assembly protein FimT/FimU [Candidatus Binatia bacterium]